MVTISSITDVIVQHPEEILLWTNGFFSALALRRGRIESLINKAVPVGTSSGGQDGSK